MTKVLVIGGSYFAGRVFVEDLAATGAASIHMFNRGRFPLGMAGVAEHVGDRERPADIRQVIPTDDWTAVVDFCAYEPAHVSGLLENLSGRVGQYVLISTTSVYAGGSALPLDEDAALLSRPVAGHGAAGEYAYNKLLAERRAAEECRQRGIPLTILRPSIIYGYYNYAPRETYFFDLLRQKKPIVIPEPDLALFSVIWVGDLAQVIVRCIGETAAFGEIYNLASDELISYGRIVDVLSEITGKTLQPTPMPPAEIDRQKLPLPFPLAEHLVYSGRKATRAFSIEHKPFRDGLREALKYYLMVQRRVAGGS